MEDRRFSAIGTGRNIDGGQTAALDAAMIIIMMPARRQLGVVENKAGLH